MFVEDREEFVDGRPRLISYLLGSVTVDDILAAQRRMIYELERSGEVALVLCEHSPALTIGRSGSHSHIRLDDENPLNDSIVPRFVSRGGGCWLHAPGQIAGYLIGDIALLAESTNDFLNILETALLEVLADFDVRAQADLAHTGLFVGNKRLVALGVSVVRNVVHYGFLLNVGPSLRSFECVEEPGSDHRVIRQTSMEAIRARPVPLNRLRYRLVERFREAFRLNTGPIFTDADGLSPLPEVVINHVCR